MLHRNIKLYVGENRAFCVTYLKYCRKKHVSDVIDMIFIGSIQYREKEMHRSKDRKDHQKDRYLLQFDSCKTGKSHEFLTLMFLKRQKDTYALLQWKKYSRRIKDVCSVMNRIQLS